MRRLVLLSLLAGSLLAAPAAHAAIPSALGVTCTRRRGWSLASVAALRRGARPASWDGTPIDVNVAFPADPSPATDGNYPLIIVGHGYGGSKIGFGSSGSTSGLRRFTSRGYAVFSMTDRGFHESCGSRHRSRPAVRRATAGYIHLMDNRY